LQSPLLDSFVVSFAAKVRLVPVPQPKYYRNFRTKIQKNIWNFEGYSLPLLSFAQHILFISIAYIIIVPQHTLHAQQTGSYQQAALQTIDSLTRVIPTLEANQLRADALIQCITKHIEIGTDNSEIARLGKELLDISQRRSYKRGVSWGICAIAFDYEQRDNVLFGQYAYDARERFAELRDTLGLALAERIAAAFHFYQGDYALSMRFYNQALQRYESSNNFPNVAWMLYHKAILFGYQGNYIVSLSNQFKALRLFEQIRVEAGIAAANEDLGVALQRIGSTKKALEYFRKALAINNDDTSRLIQGARIRLRIAECYEKEGTVPLAQAYLDTALLLVSRFNTISALIVRADIYDLLGSLERNKGDTAKALAFFLKAFHTLDSANVRGNDVNFILYRLGSTYFALHDYKQAEREFHNMLERALRGGDKRNSSRAMLWLGKTEYELGNMTEAMRYGREALAAAKNIGQLEFATTSAELLAKVVEKNDTKLSLEYTKLAGTLRDSIATLERTQQLAGLEALYNLDREKSLSELLRKDNAEQSQTAIRQRWLLIGTLVLLSIFVVGAFVLVRLNTRMNTTNQELAQQTERIKAISKIGAEIASNLDLERAIILVYGYINQLMDAPILNIGDYLPLEGCIRMRYLIENSEFVPPPTVRMSDEQRPAVRCVLKRRPIVMNNIDIPVLVGMKPASLVYVPLISGDRVIGVFSVQSLKKNSYSEANVNLLTAISAYIATALENASAFARIRAQQAELEQQAATIQLTNVTLSERNLHLEQLTGKITENIRYAQTIQQAVLPLESEITEMLGEHVILYKPMEVISGDFYWLQRTEFATLVAVVDCTGHGIPGAFMSMIGNDLLNQIVLEKGITSPSWILTELHYAVRHALKQTNDMDSNQDGMDVCLCRIEADGITFAGARRPLYIVQNGEIITLDGDTKPIGGFQREQKRTFTSKRLDLDLRQPAMIYLTSDGYADQHNRPTRTKLGTERFTKLLREIAPKSMEEQRAVLEAALAEHQGDTPQRDDITILGIRLQSSNSSPSLPLNP
jgi:serine phosphatase RsbU (regulator of sigma subunit)/TolA-binding protein